jgi:hypothetical protein
VLNSVRPGVAPKAVRGVEEPILPGTINDDLEDHRIVRAVRKQVREYVDLLKSPSKEPLIVRHRVIHWKSSPSREITVTVIDFGIKE